MIQIPYHGKSEKVCTGCKKLLSAENFGLTKDVHTSKVTGKTSTKYYLNSKCKPCARKQTREWAYANRDYMFNKTREWRETLKKAVYEHYGGKCICCGEEDYMFLTLDHINNDGHKERTRPAPGELRKRKIGGDYYKHIIDSGFPDDLQLMCYNCNCGKQRNFGVCPHVGIVTPKYGSRKK